MRGKIVILVDDGVATGACMRAALAVLRQARPARIVVAVPVASAETCDELRDEVDEVICSWTPEPFFAVGHWYEDFSQTSDEEVRELLGWSAGQKSAVPPSIHPAVTSGRSASPIVGARSAWTAAAFPSHFPGPPVVSRYAAHLGEPSSPPRALFAARAAIVRSLNR